MKDFINNLAVILSLIYLWLWFVLLYTKEIIYEPYQLPLGLIALAIYLGDKINNLKK